MKNLKAKNWFMIVLGAIMLILSIAVLIMGLTDPEWANDDAKTGYIALCATAFILAIVCAFIGLRPLWTMSEKNVTTIEATFLSIGKYGNGWVGCYFEVNGQETRIAVNNEVYSPRLLMPGAKYKLTRRKKDGDVLKVERMD